MKRFQILAVLIAAIAVGAIASTARAIEPPSTSLSTMTDPNMNEASYGVTLTEDGLVIKGSFKNAVDPAKTSVASSLFDDDSFVEDELACSVTSSTAFTCSIDIADVTLANSVAGLSAKIEVIKGLGITFGAFIPGMLSNSATCKVSTVATMLSTSLITGFTFEVPVLRPINPILILDTDADDDTVLDADDNCVDVANLDQADWNEDGVGDVCSDVDDDSVTDADDNCVEDSNANQADADEDGIGDVCDEDFISPSATVPLSAGEGCSMNPVGGNPIGMLWVLAGAALLAVRRKQ